MPAKPVSPRKKKAGRKPALSAGITRAQTPLQLETERLMSDIERQRREVDSLTSHLTDIKRELQWTTNTRSWKVTQPLRSATHAGRQFTALVRDAPRGLAMLTERLANEGVGNTMRWLRDVWNARTEDWFEDEREFYRHQLKMILLRYGDRPIIVAPPLIDWSVPLFQRPQHLAKQLAAEGYLYFYGTNNVAVDNIEGFLEVSPGCFVTNQHEMVQALNRTKVVHMCSTALVYDLETVRRIKRRGDKILYEYIDEIHPDISGTQIPRHVIKRHLALLADSSTACVATADKLLKDVSALRQQNYALVTNGVEYEHFVRARDGLQVPAVMQKIKARGKPVIGYFGALAKWFDYDLIRKLAEARPNYEIVLLGPDYDGSAKGARLEKLKNVSLLGSVQYRQLPEYAQCFDVSTVPFVVNEITESTSPIKLFEYMAIGKPIVTSNLPECRKYKSCLIGKTPAEFIAQVDRALALKPKSEYFESLEQEARDNTWRSKAAAIRELLDSTFGLAPEQRRVEATVVER